MPGVVLLSAAQRRRIEPLFPRARGLLRVDDRKVISGIVSGHAHAKGLTLIPCMLEGSAAGGACLSNYLLLTLGKAALDEFLSQSTSISLPRGTPLFNPYEPVEVVYFLEDGVATIIAEAQDSGTGTVIIGKEGYLLPSTVLGVDAVPNRSEMFVSGRALQIAAGPFRDFLIKHPQFSIVLHRFAYVFIAQLMSSLLSRSSDNAETQLARLLLMLHDRSDADDIAITHGECATFLSVRRSTVTEAMHLLEGRGAIVNDRGCVSIRSRTLLRESVSFSSYGKAEQEYDRVIGSLGRPIP